MTPYEARLSELVDSLQATLDQIRDHIRRGPSGVQADELESYAEEAERAQDA